MTSLAQQLRSTGLRYRLSVGRTLSPGNRQSSQSVRHPLFLSASNAAIGVKRGVPRATARRSRLEAVLFLSREPLTLRKLAQLANLADGTEARTLLTGLRARYDERNSAFQVAQVAGGYQLLSRCEFAPWLRPQLTAEREIRLSSPTLETLAVVAYRQPVLRTEVEAIRGVGCGEILRQLMDHDLLRIVGRSEELGRPLRYGTTKRFLQVFGLCSLDELPWAQQLRRSSQTEPMDGDLPAAGVDTG